MRKVVTIAVAVAAVAAATVSGVSQARTVTAADTATPKQGIKWGECDKDVGDGLPLPEGMQCGTLKVPLDYQRPEGRMIDVAVSRLPSKNPEKRRGILLTNPGGPSPGLGYLAFLVTAKLPQAVLDSYDLVGFDPRGMGRSTPVKCDLTEEQQFFGNIPPYARNAADVAKRAEQSQQIAEQCAASDTAWMLPYVSAKNTARDMDSIRTALGEEKASFLGASWGTYLGSVYATMFPKRTDRVVLDSNLGPAGWDYESQRLWSQGMDDRFPDFAKYVAANHREYGLGRTAAQVKAKYLQLAARLDRTPVKGPDVVWDGALLRLITFGYTYGATQLATLAEVFKALEANQPPPPLPAGETAKATAAGVDNLISARYYMICNDSHWPTSLQSYQRNVAIDRIRHPLFGAAGANISPCAYWPKPVEEPVKVGDNGPSNVLMVQNLRDPATPLAGANELRKALGDRARMVTADQGGHGVYLLNKNQCANTAATSFLLTGRLPERDYHCSADATPR
ncbi:alpha/beta hydrolase [Kribbella soli]|uniref:Alpha/beta hydrolase n=1 Tax=Kribbella soli TaxID=1124743 RepID=A0A4R0HAW8_9ACTN|nr:alpha/beta hydrolase [Kribbella soli]TCC06250.1 alpha/beta hydrolase [Kribbella soli]